jgi:hypothetical protein
VRDSIRKNLDLERKALQSSIVADPPTLIKDRSDYKQGFLFKQNSVKEWLLRYVVIQGDQIVTFKKLKKDERYDFKKPKKLVNIFLSRV